MMEVDGRARERLAFDVLALAAEEKGEEVTIPRVAASLVVARTLALARLARAVEVAVERGRADGKLILAWREAEGWV